jgi:predicted RNA methylase
MTAQTNMFGEPELSPALSQWFTPDWISRRLATWVHPGMRVLEPACGAGNLIRPLLAGGHAPERITAVELDEAWADHCRIRFRHLVTVNHGNFLAQEWGRFDAVLMNPPFEGGLHAQFLDHALDHAPVVLALMPVAIEFGEERDRTFWALKGRVTRRARLPERVKYGGKSQASFETVAIRVERRSGPRTPGELCAVLEEVWREGEEC